MVRYYLHKLLVFALSMVIAINLFALTFSVVSIGLLHSDSFIKSGLERNNEKIIAAIDAELKKTADEFSVSEEMLTGAVNEKNIGIITDEVSHNFIYGYATSFTNSTELYSAVVSSISDYNNANNNKMSDGEIAQIAALAVDSINEAIGNSDTATVKVFSFVRSRSMMIILVVNVLALIASLIALTVFNKGRHRKFNYIGMGFTTGGAAIIATAAVIILKNMLENYHFCSFEAYDSAVRYCISILFNIVFIPGIIYFIVGFVMLFKNYRYFKIRKDAFIERHKLSGDDKMSDYMDDYYTKNMRTHIPGEEFEKDVQKIDFEQE